MERFHLHMDLMNKIANKIASIQNRKRFIAIRGDGVGRLSETDGGIKQKPKNPHRQTIVWSLPGRNACGTGRKGKRGDKR